MPATAAVFGIQSHQGTLISKLNIKDQVEVAELIGSDGEVADAHPHKRMKTGSVEGHGETDVAVGAGDPGIEGLEGLTIITEFDYSEENSGHSKSSYSWRNYPHATSSGTPSP